MNSINGEQLVREFNEKIKCNIADNDSITAQLQNGEFVIVNVSFGRTKLFRREDEKVEIKTALMGFAKKINQFGLEETTFIAARLACFDLLKLLIDAGVPLRSANHNILHEIFGATNYPNFYRMPSIELIEILEHLKPDVLQRSLFEKDSNGNTPLDLMLQSGNEYFVSEPFLVYMNPYIVKRSLENLLAENHGVSNLDQKSKKNIDVI